MLKYVSTLSKISELIYLSIYEPFDISYEIDNILLSNMSFIKYRLLIFWGKICVYDTLM